MNSALSINNSIFGDENMYFNIFSISNDKETDFQIEETEYKKNVNESIKKKKKKKDNEYILKKKAESARKTRLRKKLVQKAILEENIKLKKKLNDLENKLLICLCNECKTKLKIPLNHFQITTEEKSSKSLFVKNLFIISILACVFFLFYLNSTSVLSNNVRKLSQLYYFSLSYNDMNSYKISYDGIYISFGDYYSIINKQNYFMNDKPLYFYLNKKVKILEEKNLNNNITTDNCKNCFVHISGNNKRIPVDQRKNSFKLFLKPNYLPPTGNSYYDKNDNSIPILEIDCLVIGYSKHQIYIKDEKK